MAVVVATGHMAKGLEKFTSWAGFLPHAWAEPMGVQTAIKMNAKTMAQPAAWFTLPTLSVAAMTLLALGSLLALRFRLCQHGPHETDLARVGSHGRIAGGGPGFDRR